MIGAIVQTRMSSRRMPGKVLQPLAGRPLLAYLVERLERARRIERVIIATSRSADDDAIADFAHDVGVEVYRGALENVAKRVLEAAGEHDIDVAVRISGDSPLLDQRIVDRAVELFEENEVHLVTNVHPRTFPTGQSVEVFRTSLLRHVHDRMNEDQLEHVTKYFYEHAGDFEILNFTHEPSLLGRRMTVDEPGDAVAIENLLVALSRPHWEYTLDELIVIEDGLRQS